MNSIRKKVEWVYLALFIPLYFLISKITNKWDMYQTLVILILAGLAGIFYILFKDKSKLTQAEKKKVNLRFIVKNIIWALIVLIGSLILERITHSDLFGWMSTFGLVLGIQFIFVIIHSILIFQKRKV